MKGRYRSMRLKKYQEEKDPWPPIKSKSYITLALVHQKELQTRQETTTTIYLRTKGDIQKIPQTTGAKKLTDIAQIFDPVSGRFPNSILIEGHAGIGKTTLVKEICTEWAEGKLLTSDKLVLLLLLRDPSVQKITNELKLIEHFTKSTSKVEQLLSYLEDNHGVGVTIIIDGFDELSTELRQVSFFRELIEKRSLAQAKIVVTSRPSSSACLHHVMDRRIEVLGFERSSKNQYVMEALQDSPSKLEKLQRHILQYPNIDAICYIPLIMSIMIFLCVCQPDDLPPTATRMYANFILHTICHYLKRVGKIHQDKIINKLEQYPSVVVEALKQLEKVAFDGLLEDKIVFTVEELPVICKDDPTCYGLLQSTECYSAEEAGTANQSFNFLHLGMQEYFAAKYATMLPNDEINALLKISFIVTSDGKYTVDADGMSVRLSNMWILYCGITSGQCKVLNKYLTTYYRKNIPIDTGPLAPGYDRVPRYPGRELYSQKRPTSHQTVSNTTTISKDILNDPVKVLYLFQCFQEAQDNELCEFLSQSFDGDTIDISTHYLLSHQVVSLGFFLSRSNRKWNELNLRDCHIGDHGINILCQHLCRDKVDKYKMLNINLSKNNLTGASSCYIADLITHLQPHTLDLHENCISNVRKISTVILTTFTVKVLNISDNDIPVQEVVAISDMMICLEELNICNTNLDDFGVELLSEGLMCTKTLQVLYMSNNNIGSSGAITIANALISNDSLERLYTSYNDISQDAALAIAKAITNNKKLKTLSLWGYNDSIDKPSVMIIIMSLHNNNTITELRFPGKRICDVDGEVKIINKNRSLGNCCKVHFTNVTQLWKSYVP